MSIFSRYQTRVPRKDLKGCTETPKTLGEHLKKRRLSKGMSQASLAKLLGVTKDCVWLWEAERNTPQLHHYPALIAFLGYYPFDHETDTLGGKITRYKNLHGMSTKKLAKLLGVDEGTVAQWERNETKPLARSMSRIISILHTKATHI
ncbi:helix-turn-helix domain-containing protein [Asinibacterium sp. OR53]|uniref:helix-turn-helix domain-containing protein n=1 Tax=Asinibacterium sp. OR53 TaxID=925409 RepID=UPI0035103E25